MAILALAKYDPFDTSFGFTIWAGVVLTQFKGRLGLISKEHVYSMLIHEGHLDSFGHVNNATYLQILEQARWDWITNNGHGLSQIKSTKKGPIILKIEMSFKKEIVNRTPITVHTGISRVLHEKVFEIEQRIFQKENILSTVAHMQAGYFDLQNRKLIRPSEKWLNALGMNEQSYLEAMRNKA